MPPTPEMIEQFKKAREAMLSSDLDLDTVIQADPSCINASIAKLTPEAQIYARKIRDIVLSEEDHDVMRSKILAIRAALSPSISKELDEHRERMAVKYGLPPKCE